MHTTRTMLRTLTMTATVALLGLAASPAALAAGSRDAVASSAPDEGGVVNLNTATEDELMLLPGVGPSKAGAILAWRTKHGNFKKVDDLTRVKGFGRKSLARLRPHLAVSGATTFHGKKATSDEKSGGATASAN